MTIRYIHVSFCFVHNVSNLRVVASVFMLAHQRFLSSWYSLFARRCGPREQRYDMQKYVIRVARVCNVWSMCVWTRRWVWARTRIWKSQWQPYQSYGPRGEGVAHGERGERPTNQVPNIGCQEFSYLDAALGKSQAFPRKFFCRHDGIDTRYRPGSGVKARTIRRIQEVGRNIRRMRCDKKGSIFPTVPYYFIKWNIDDHNWIIISLHLHFM